MKCTECNGTGRSIYGYNQSCFLYNGSGIIEPLTNEEWRKTCSAGVAHAGAYEVRNCNTNGMLQTQNTDFWLAWLKEIHNDL